jgi:predicted nucleotidyltransferase
MVVKATIVRLDPDSHAALGNMSKLLGRPMNKLVNEAVRDYLLKESPAEREMTGTLTRLREFRAHNSSHSEALQAPAHPTLDADAEPALLAARDFVARASTRRPVKAAILFGSRARGTHRSDSDVDIAVLLRGPRGKVIDTSLDLADIAFDVLLDTGIYIQPIPIWESEWEHPETHPNPRLLENIRREGLPL